MMLKRSIRFLGNAMVRGRDCYQILDAPVLTLDVNPKPETYNQALEGLERYADAVKAFDFLGNATIHGRDWGQLWNAPVPIFDETPKP